MGIFKSRWTQLGIEKVEVLSTGYLITVNGRQGATHYFFDRSDIKYISMTPGSERCGTVIVKKSALKRKGL